MRLVGPPKKKRSAKCFSAGHSTDSFCQTVRMSFRRRFGLFFDQRAFFVQKAFATERTQQRNFLVAQFFVMALEAAFALRAGGPKYFNHDAKTEVRSQKSEPRISPIPDC